MCNIGRELGGSFGLDVSGYASVDEPNSYSQHEKCGAQDRHTQPVLGKPLPSLPQAHRESDLHTDDAGVEQT